MKKTKEQTSKAYEELLMLKAEPVLKLWLEKINEQKILEPSAVYGYFPCGSIGNELIIFDPDTYHEVGSFSFPRQKSGNRYCIADFYKDLSNDKPVDVMPMQAVTMGSNASDYAQQLFDNNSYSDYLYFIAIYFIDDCIFKSIYHCYRPRFQGRRFITSISIFITIILL